VWVMSFKWARKAGEASLAVEQSLSIRNGFRTTREGNAGLLKL